RGLPRGLRLAEALPGIARSRRLVHVLDQVPRPLGRAGPLRIELRERALLPRPQAVADLSLSVVMPTYNRARFIGEALDSLLRQPPPPLEVIVVDDRSTDDTRARVLAHPLGSRLRYELQPENRGASVARNVGVEIARGEAIVFLDSDDLLEPNHHEAVLQILSAMAD